MITDGSTAGRPRDCAVPRQPAPGHSWRCHWTRDGGILRAGSPARRVRHVARLPATRQTWLPASRRARLCEVATVQSGGSSSCNTWHDPYQSRLEEQDTNCVDKIKLSRSPPLTLQRRGPMNTDGLTGRTSSLTGLLSPIRAARRPKRSPLQPLRCTKCMPSARQTPHLLKQGNGKVQVHFARDRPYQTQRNGGRYAPPPLSRASLSLSLAPLAAP